MGDAKPLPGVQGTVTSYKIKPSLSVFNGSIIKGLIQAIMTKKLQGKTYNTEDARKWTTEIADEVNAAIKDTIYMPRYKHVVQVTLAQQTGAGFYYIAKCCWDAELDSQTSDVFSNASLFCVCTVFGIYLYDDSNF